MNCCSESSHNIDKTCLKALKIPLGLLVMVLED